MEDLALKRAIKRGMLEYKRFFRKRDITTYAARKFRSQTATISRLQMRRMLNLFNARQDEVFEELKPIVRQKALDILGGDEKLMNRFVRRDKFDLTFSQKFQTARKRIRRLIKKRVAELYGNSNGEATVKELLDEAQQTWETTAEFSKFIAYMIVDAWNFEKLEDIREHSKTGKFEIFTSDNHEKEDICDAHAGIYDIDDDVELPPYHPYCVCGVRDA